MDFLSYLHEQASPFVQALAVSAGGLIGVFATLGVFFLMIWAADRLNKKD
jgi:cell division protein FtsW (lipid II flippase)